MRVELALTNLMDEDGDGKVIGGKVISMVMRRMRRILNVRLNEVRMNMKIIGAMTRN